MIVFQIYIRVHVVKRLRSLGPKSAEFLYSVESLYSGPCLNCPV